MKDALAESRILELLGQCYTAADMLVWLQSPNGLLGGAIPHDLMQRGEAQRVLVIVQQLADSVYV